MPDQHIPVGGLQVHDLKLLFHAQICIQSLR